MALALDGTSRSQACCVKILTCPYVLRYSVRYSALCKTKTVRVDMDEDLPNILTACFLKNISNLYGLGIDVSRPGTLLCSHLMVLSLFKFSSSPSHGGQGKTGANTIEVAWTPPVKEETLARTVRSHRSFYIVMSQSMKLEHQ